MKKKKEKKIDSSELVAKKKKFTKIIIFILCLLAVFFTRRQLQNDTFYTIKIGKLILDNGIDMMDHFSFHKGLAYTYPHWLYDVFIYLIYSIGKYKGLYISSILLFIVLLNMFFRISKKINNNITVPAFVSFIFALSIGSFITARAQAVSFLIFLLQIYFIEQLLNNGKKRYILYLVILSLILCNIHVAVWPFYFIIYLPYFAEYISSLIIDKFKDKNKFFKFLDNKFELEVNKNIRYIFIAFILSPLTGLITPIELTPYTYLIKTMMGNSQSYIQEHQPLSWINSPFTIIIAFETYFLAILAKVKLRDIFMITGLVLMSVFATRHLSLLALIGTLCFSRVFVSFLKAYEIDFDNKAVEIFTRKKVYILVIIVILCLGSVMLYFDKKNDFVSKELYPTEAVKYIKENLDYKNIRLYNEYNFGSYLLLNDIPVFIDSRADLYTKQFSGFDYDIFDDYEFVGGNYRKVMNFYDFTHVITYNTDESINKFLKIDSNYNELYHDDYFIIYERIGEDNFSIEIK